MNIQVRNVLEADLKEILAIANGMTLDDLPDTKSAENSGFLVSRFSLDNYVDFYNEAEHFFVATESGKIKGFLLAYESTSIKDSETVNKLLQKNLVEHFVLIKQIAVIQRETGKGVASALYRALYDTVPDKGLAAAIVTEPYNVRSVKFHEKERFQHIFDVMPPEDPDGQIRTRGIWYRGPRGKENEKPVSRLHVISGSEDIGAIQEKYNAALGLYTHEDNLNWNKLAMLVTFMMALFTGFSYQVEVETSLRSIISSLMLIGFGLYINYLFYMKIVSGLEYMQSHKDKVKILESKLIGMNPNLTCLINVGDNTNISNKSKTSVMLERVPILSAIL